MAKKTTLKAAPRARTGSGRLTQMRREGWLPSVIYGRGAANLNLKVDAKSFGELLARSSSENIVVNLEIDGEGDSKTEITAHIPAHLNGEAPGVKAGGVIEQYVHAIEITCLPDDLPETIELDISKLELGDSLHVGEVTYPKGVRPTHAADVVIVHIGRGRGRGRHHRSRRHSLSLPPFSRNHRPQPSSEAAGVFWGMALKRKTPDPREGTGRVGLQMLTWRKQEPVREPVRRLGSRKRRRARQRRR
ncbi:MAG: 50S ribosomal protein L25/general stress protein Ctc [Akkermansiaceae bacterium]|nr:50S ribosomal protein L25/general stress protein Ctc [Akkermansiaceae bacterium]